MKTFFAILGLCIVGIMADVTNEEKERDEANKNACLKELGLDADVISKSFKGKIDKNDEKLGCYFTCISKKMGLIHSDGTINESQLIIQNGVDKEKALMIRNKCSAMKGDNECQTILKVITCILDEDSL